MKRVLNQQTFNGGIAESEKEGIAGSSFFSKHLNIYDDPRSIQLFPAPIKVSGDTVTGLVKWIVPATGYNTKTYFYDWSGSIYSQSSAGVWTFLQTTPSSSGQGMDVHDDYLYYSQAIQIGRYGPLSGSPTFTDNWHTGLNDTSASTFAPVKAFKEGLAVGHGNKIGWWDGAVWTVDRIELPPGFNIRSLEVFNEYLVIGCYRGAQIVDNEEGYLFFWDGSSDTFNYFVTAQDGGVAALLNTKNRLISFLGADGSFYIDYQPFTKIQQIPKIKFSEYVDIYPGALTNWRSLSFFGISGGTDTTEMLRGVYAYGSTSSKYAPALCYAFTISTGRSGQTVRIGAVKGIGNNLYISWQDGVLFGVDKVTNSGDCYTSGYFEQLIFDNNTTYRDKRVDRIKATHLALETGQGIQVSTSIERADYIDGAINSSGDETNFTPESLRFKEIQNKVTLISSSGDSPVVTSLAMLFDDQKEEQQF